MSKHTFDSTQLDTEASKTSSPDSEAVSISSVETTESALSVLNLDIDPNPIAFESWLEFCSSEINIRYSSRRITDELAAHVASNIRHALVKIMMDCGFSVDWTRSPAEAFQLRFEGHYNPGSHATTMNALQATSGIAALVVDSEMIQLRDRLLRNRIMEEIQSSVEVLLKCMTIFAPSAIMELWEGRLGKGLMARLKAMDKFMADNAGFSLRGYKKILATAEKIRGDAGAALMNGGGRVGPTLRDDLYDPLRPPPMLSFDHLSSSCCNEINDIRKRLQSSEQSVVANEVSEHCDSAFQIIMRDCGYIKYDHYKIFGQAERDNRHIALETLFDGIKNLSKIGRCICLTDGGEIQKSLVNDGCADHLARCLLVLCEALNDYNREDTRPLVNDDKDGGLAERLGDIATWMMRHDVRGYDEVVAEIQRYT